MRRIPPIREPRWKYPRSLGIAKRYLNDDIIVECTYKNSRGDRLYPNPFFIKKEDAEKYPDQFIKGTLLKLIPISAFKEI